MIKKLKDKMYDKMVRKNPRVRYEYERYVMENIDEHKKKRCKHLRVLFKLKWHYQIKRSKKFLIFNENEGCITREQDNNYEMYAKFLKESEIRKDTILDIELEYIENDCFLYWNGVHGNYTFCLYEFCGEQYELRGVTNNNYIKMQTDSKEAEVIIVAYCGTRMICCSELVRVEEKYVAIKNLEVSAISMDEQVVLMWPSLFDVISVNVYKVESGVDELYANIQGQGCTVRNLRNNVEYRFCVKSVYEGKEYGECEIVATPKKDQSLFGSSNKINQTQKELIKYFNGKDAFNPKICAESVFESMPYPHVISKAMLQYDVIAFDIFDTLIFRPFKSPQDLFWILENEFGIMNFKNIRINAEKKVRKLKQDKYNNSEVTIEEIYKEIERETGLNAEEGAAKEFEVECHFCYKNPYTERILQIMRNLNKKVVIISDIYYSSEQLRKLLLSAGLDINERIYSSCDYSASKRNGELLQIVKKDFESDTTFFLIDDNMNNIKSARNNEWGRALYQNVNNTGDKYRRCVRQMSGIVGSYYAGIINSKLHNGIAHYSEAFEYGYICGGLYVLGFCSWIERTAKTDMVDKIIFISRDGAIYKDCYDKYFEGKTEYVYWSRLVAARMSMEQDRSAFFDNVLYVNKGSLEIREILKLINCEHLLTRLKKFNLSEQHVLSDSNIEIVKEFINEYWDEIKIAQKDEQAIAIDYLKRKIGNAKRIALIDVGWKGANLLSIDWFLQNKCNLDVDVKCYMAGITTEKNLAYCLTDKFKGYLFSSLNNKDMQRKHVAENNGFNSMFFEMLSQADYPSTKGFIVDEQGFKVEFSLSEPENSKMLIEIQNGIKEFIDDYFIHMGKYRYLLNISGRDAYLPFSLFTNNLEYMVRFLGEYRFCRELSSGLGNKNESVSQLMLKKYKEVQ